MRWIKSIDDKKWYEYEGVTKLGCELNKLFRAVNGFRVDETEELFHVIILSDGSQNLKLYFTSDISKEIIVRIFNNKAHPITQSPLSKWNTTRRINKAYVLNYDPDLEIKPPYIPEQQNSTEVDIQPLGSEHILTEFKLAIGKLRSAEHPRLLSLLIGKYHTADIGRGESINEKNSSFDVFEQIGYNTLRANKYGRCHKKCLDRPRYVFRPTELCVNERPIPDSDLAISAYRSLATKAQDVEVVKHDPEKAISDIVYQKIPPEKTYRESLNRFSPRNGKSTIVLVDQNVNSVLGV